MSEKAKKIRSFLMRLRLFLKIVYRDFEGDPIKPALAWEVAGIIHHG